MPITNKIFPLTVLNIGVTNNTNQEPKRNQSTTAINNENQEIDDAMLEELNINPIFFA